MSIAEFIERCDRYCTAQSVSRVWLSKRLFQDTYRLDQLAAGGSDVGVKRLAQAAEDLEKLEGDASEQAA